MTEKTPKPTLSLAAAMHLMPQSLTKDKENKFHNYQYTSADSLFLAVRQQLAAQGLGIWQDELKLERIQFGPNKTPAIDCTYEIAITPNGQPPTERCEKISLVVPIANEKTFAAVRTHALKYYLRGKLLMATGDFDDELDAQESDPSIKHVDATKKEPPKSKAKATSTAKDTPGKVIWHRNEETFKLTASGKFATPEAGFKSLYAEMLKYLDADANSELAVCVYEENKKLLEKIPEKGQDRLRKLYDEHYRIYCEAVDAEIDKETGGV